MITNIVVEMLRLRMTLYCVTHRFFPAEEIAVTLNGMDHRRSWHLILTMEKPDL